MQANSFPFIEYNLYALNALKTLSVCVFCLPEIQQGKTLTVVLILVVALSDTAQLRAS